MQDSEQQVLDLLQQHIESSRKAIEVSRLEAERCERQALECRAAKERAEKQTQQLERQNQLSEKLHDLLIKNIQERPIEKTLQDLIAQLSALEVIVGFVGREYLKLLAKEANNKTDKENLSRALIEISRTRTSIEVGTRIESIHSEQDTNVEENYASRQRK